MTNNVLLAVFPLTTIGLATYLISTYTLSRMEKKGFGNRSGGCIDQRSH